MNVQRPTRLVLALSILALSAATASAESLGDMMRNSGWDRVVGTWANDEGNVEVTYAWKLKDHILETTTKMGDRTSVALIGVNADTEKLFHVGGDDQGGCIQGAWEVDGDEPVLQAKYISAYGEEREFSIRYQLEDDDTLAVHVEMDQEFDVTLNRVKSKKKE